MPVPEPQPARWHRERSRGGGIRGWIPRTAALRDRTGNSRQEKHKHRGKTGAAPSPEVTGEAPPVPGALPGNSEPGGIPGPAPSALFPGIPGDSQQFPNFSSCLIPAAPGSCPGPASPLVAFGNFGNSGIPGTPRSLSREFRPAAGIRSRAEFTFGVCLKKPEFGVKNLQTRHGAGKRRCLGISPGYPGNSPGYPGISRLGISRDRGGTGPGGADFWGPRFLGRLRPFPARLCGDRNPQIPEIPEIRGTNRAGKRFPAIPR